MGTIELAKMEYISVFHRPVFRPHYINPLISISLLVFICLPWSTCVGDESIIKLDPPKTEYVVSPGDDLIVKCNGAKPVIWFVPNRVTSVEVFYNNSIYEAILEFTNVTTNCVGFYICKYNLGYDEELTTGNITFSDDLEEAEGPNFYLYVDDPQQIVVDDYNIFIEGHENEPVIVPCKPTSPDVKVQLFKDDNKEDVHINNSMGFYNSPFVTYDNRHGFRIPAVNTSGTYTCRYEKNDVVETSDSVLQLYPSNFNLQKPSITDDHGTCHSNYCQILKALAGTDLQMNCTIPFRGAISIRWSYPKSEVDESRLIVRPTNIELEDYKRVAVSRLLIKNISKIDEGNYTCKYFDQSRNTEQNIMAVKVFDPNDTYIYLKEPSNIYHFKKRTGRDFIVRIDIEAFPEVTIMWYDNHNNEIRPENRKYDVRYNNEKSKLRVKNLQLADAGIYKVRAVNEYNIEDTKEFTLEVEE